MECYVLGFSKRHVEVHVESIWKVSSNVNDVTGLSVLKITSSKHDGKVIIIQE